MTLPNGVSTCVVTFGRATSYLGNDAVISGVLSADRTIVHAASGVRIGPGDDVVPNESGFLSFSVPHVNQSGMVDGAGNAITGWFYILSGVITYPSGKPEPFRRVFQVLVGQTSVDLDLIADGPVLPTFTAPSAVVTSVAGLTGAVTAEDLAGAVGGSDTGWIDITDLYAFAGFPANFLCVRREGFDVEFQINPFNAADPLYDLTNLSGEVMPDGFRPRKVSAGADGSPAYVDLFSTNGTRLGQLVVFADGHYSVQLTPPPEGDFFSGRASWRTSGAVPEPLPGPSVPS